MIVRSYFKTKEAPLCRFEQIKTITRGDGISPNLAENLDEVRRVGTLFIILFNNSLEGTIFYKIISSVRE